MSKNLCANRIFTILILLPKTFYRNAKKSKTADVELKHTQNRPVIEHPHLNTVVEGNECKQYTN
jgi:hypothetical protein